VEGAAMAEARGRRTRGLLQIGGGRRGDGGGGCHGDGRRGEN